MRGWKGAAMGVPWVLLSLLPNMAEAQARPTVWFHLSSTNVRVRQVVTINAGEQGLKGPEDDALWMKAPNGHWQALYHMGPASRFSVRFSRPGTYTLQVRIMPRQALWKHLWKETQYSAPQVVYVGGSVSLSPSVDSAAKGTTVKLAASDSHIAHPLYQFHIKTPQSAIITTPFQKAADFAHAWSMPGVYRAWVDVKTPGGPAVQSRPVAFDVYGPAVGIRFHQGQHQWVADGTETETLAMAVVDAEGDVVSNFNGTGTLTDTTAAGAVSAWGPSPRALSSLYQGMSLPLAFKNGMANMTLQAGSAVAADALEASAAEDPHGPSLSGKATIATEAQKAAAIKLTALDTYLIANESANEADYQVSVVDQVGEPMLSGTYTLAATIQGPAQFEGFGQGPNTVTYTGGAGPTPLTIYSIAAETGKVTLRLSGSGFKTVSTSLPAVLGGQPYRMGVSALPAILSNGQTATLTLTQVTKSGGLPDPASLDNSAYVVSITDANGNPAQGFTLDGAPYTGPVSFPVAPGANDFYAVSQTVALQAVDVSPGKYTIVVSDQDGLWKPSTPFVITVKG
ncbi:hypothetical protein [Sulfobacillus harzensis]|uniref:Carboxypeptidase regulatory-like domain-containing protein n=1 Tax=Sulfobacillus harzensis TaxID=2729629 RepID=A0A7Y0Q2U4_9FIRM|nr:hypothetical protein [Sulfobacillus harzensis]NMP22907.1 hypothetical protein [Sulfobacillus harzensis]